MMTSMAYFLGEGHGAMDPLAGSGPFVDCYMALMKERFNKQALISLLAICDTAANTLHE